jgi:protein SERAC1
MNSQSIALNRDHINISKFGDPEESDFKIIVSHLSEMVIAAPSKITEIWDRHERLEGA